MRSPGDQATGHPRAARLFALLAWALVGCVATRGGLVELPLGPENPPSAASDSASAAASGEVDPPWLPPALAPLIREQAEVPALAHGGGRYTMKVRTSDPEAYRGEGEVPRGFLACAEHQEEQTEGPLLCMRRGLAGWRYGVKLPGARTWAREGRLADCASCHEMSPRGGLYGLRP